MKRLAFLASLIGLGQFVKAQPPTWVRGKQVGIRFDPTQFSETITPDGRTQVSLLKNVIPSASIKSAKATPVVNSTINFELMVENIPVWVAVFRNGVRLEELVDYTRTGKMITLTAEQAALGDTRYLVVDYV